MAHIHPEPDAASDVTGTLAELERKLRELERELTSLGRRRAAADDAPDAAADAATRSSSDSTAPTATDVPPGSQPYTQAPAGSLGGRLIDEAAEARATTIPAAERRAQSPSQTPASSMPPSSMPPSSAVTSSGTPSEPQLSGLAELRRFGTRLEQSTSELIEAYQQVLERVLAQFSDSTPAAPTPDDIMFEGRIELGVGPFYDIGSLSLFEQQVAGLNYASDVAVRRFEASHAVLDLRLSQPLALVRELRAVLDADFSVREIAGGRLMLTFDDV